MYRLCAAAALLALAEHYDRNGRFSQADHADALAREVLAQEENWGQLLGYTSNPPPVPADDDYEGPVTDEILPSRDSRKVPFIGMRDRQTDDWIPTKQFDRTYRAMLMRVRDKKIAPPLTDKELPPIPGKELPPR